MMYGIAYVLVYWGEQYISSGLASVIFAAMPFYAGILAHIFIRDEKLNIIKLLGIIIGFAGILIIFKDNLHVYGKYGIYGMLANAAAPIFSASAAVIIKKRLSSFDTIALTGFQMLVGAVCLLPLALILENPAEINFTYRATFALIYLAIFGSALTFVTYYRLIRVEGVTKMSLIAFVTPLVAIIIGRYFADEHLNAGMLIGGTLVATGIALVTGYYQLLYRKMNGRGSNR